MIKLCKFSLVQSAVVDHKKIIGYSNSDNISVWKDVTKDDLLDVKIEQGIEVKIIYNRETNPHEMVELKVSNTNTLTISLRDGRCIFQGCPIRTLDMNTVQNGIAFILKICRKDEKLLIDLDGKKNVEIDMKTLNQGYWTCSDFWGEEENYKFQFTDVSSNLQAQFRIGGEDEEEDRVEG